MLMPETSPLSVAFLRPRLGIGGSERLVVDAARELARRGHRVTLHLPDALHPPQFPAVRELRVRRCAGASLPSQVRGRARLPLAVAKTALAALSAAARERPDVLFCDVVAQTVPLARRVLRAPVLFYCHHPDLLLAPAEARTSAAYRLYRRPLDRLEEIGLCASDLLVANSKFTADVLRSTFPGLAGREIAVLHPGVPVEPFPPRLPDSGEIEILSVARFDPAKNLALAIDALAALRSRTSADLFARTRLVVAGRFDEDAPGQSAELESLRRRVAQVGLADHVRFVLSPSEDERLALLARARCVVYTPVAEHFGYVPLEAMASGRPVVASNRGGPAETVAHAKTGLLCAPEAEAFAEAIAALVRDRDAAAQMGEAGRERVSRLFSLESFGDRLVELLPPPRRPQ